MTISNKRGYSGMHFGMAKKPKKVVEPVEDHNSDDDSSDGGMPGFPFPLPMFNQQQDEKIYLEDNHLYYMTDVNDESIDKVRKLARDYANRINKLSKSKVVEIKPKPLVLHINSPGGSVHAGFALYDFLIEYGKHIPVYTVVEGVAASAATIISVAGVKRYITPTSYMLIHQLSTFMGGNYEQLKDEMANCNKIMKRIIDIYVEHTNITKKNIPDLLKHDLLWNAKECLKQGLVDDIKVLDIFTKLE